jgi:hypothetical protein
MANLIRASRGASPIGPRWAENFVQRQETLKMRFQRKINYQRALTEDPRIVRGWFELVRAVDMGFDPR